MLRLKAVSGREASLFPQRAEGDHLSTGRQGELVKQPVKIHPVTLHKIHRHSTRQPPLNHLRKQKHLRGQLRPFDIAVVRVELQQPKRAHGWQQKHQQMEKCDPAGHGR